MTWLPLPDVLPEGWTEARLGDGLVVSVQAGFACGNHNREGEGIAHLRPMNVSVEGLIDLGETLFVPDDLASRPERLLRAGDVLFNNTNSAELVGKTAYYSDDVPRAFSNHMTRVRCRDDVLNASYCAFVLHELWRRGYFEHICNHHVSQASVSSDVLLGTTIPVPPLREQERIIARLDAVVTAMEAPKRRVAAVRREVVRARAAVLAAACDGELTREYRQTHEASGDGAPLTLLDSVRTARGQRYRLALQKRKQAGAKRLKRTKALPREHLQDASALPDGWEWALLEELADVGTGTTPSRTESKYWTDGSVPWVTSSVVNKGVVSEPSEYVTERALSETNLTLYPQGTLLIAMYGEGQTRGRVTELGIESTTNQALAALVFDGPAAAVRDYVRLFLERNYAAVRAGSAGGVQPNLNLSKVKAIRIPLPPLDEQQAIIDLARDVLDRLRGIDARMQKATDLIEAAARASRLQALRGEVVPLEADLALAEGRDYEPARVALDRLQTEAA